MSRVPFAKALAAAALALAGCASAPAMPGPPGPQRTDALFRQIQRGMTRDEVTRLAGPPDNEMAFPATHTYAWDYRYVDTWGYPANYSVTFGADDRVASTIERRIEPPGK